LPIPHDAQGKPAIHYTTIYKVFAKWADDESLWQAFVASVRHLAAEKQLDLTVLHGDGTNTVAKKGAMGLATRAVAYLLAADNVSGPLPIPLREVNQPVSLTRNRFSRRRARLLACI
jgi:hypothetical protein